MFVALSFIICLGLVGVYTYVKVKKSYDGSQDSYFLAGRSLTGLVIGSSIILTNLSTEQLVGQSAQSYMTNMGPMAWEATACAGLIMLALFFLPTYLKNGITTIPEFLENRFDKLVKQIVALLMLLGFIFAFLPTVLYSGALVFNQIFKISERFNINDFTAVALIALFIGICGALYAILGGLKAAANADALFGVGLVIGGVMIPFLGISSLGNGSFINGFEELLHIVPAEKFNSINPYNSKAPMMPWPLLFTGLFFNNVYYFCTNQAIIQRTLAATSLKEAQKGVLFAGVIKVFCPLFITVCGIIAYAKFGETISPADLAYPTLVTDVLPAPLLGFFAAVLAGAILSSFNGGLNACVALFTLDIFKPIFRPNISDSDLVKAGRNFGYFLVVISIVVTPFVTYAPTGLYDFLQSMNTFYSGPILATVIVGIVSKRIPALAAKFVFPFHIILYALSKYVLPEVHYLYVLAVLFPLDVLIMFAIGKLRPRPEPYVSHDAKAVDLTPWKYRKVATAFCILALLFMYLVFSPLGLAKI